MYSKNVFDTLNIIYMFLFICSQLKKRKKERKKQNQNEFVNRFLCEDIIITFTCIKKKEREREKKKKEKKKEKKKRKNKIKKLLNETLFCELHWTRTT